MALCTGCTPPTPITTITTAVCNEITPVGACDAKYIFVHCSVAQSGLVSGADTAKAAALTAAFTADDLLVSPVLVDVTEGDPTVNAIPMGDCIADYNSIGACSITASTRQTWGVDVSGTIADEDGATLFWQQLSANTIYRKSAGTVAANTVGQYNLLKMDCNGDIYAAITPGKLGNTDILAAAKISHRITKPKIGDKCVETHTVTMNFRVCPTWIHLINKSNISDNDFLSQLSLPA